MLGSTFRNKTTSKLRPLTMVPKVVVFVRFYCIHIMPMIYSQIHLKFLQITSKNGSIHNCRKWNYSIVRRSRHSTVNHLTLKLTNSTPLHSPSITAHLNTHPQQQHTSTHIPTNSTPQHSPSPTAHRNTHPQQQHNSIHPHKQHTSTITFTLRTLVSWPNNHHMYVHNWYSRLGTNNEQSQWLWLPYKCT
jgi:hypothetical protein